MTISVLIASYGDEKWQELAETRARPSALKQSADEVLDLHESAGNIASARNALAKMAGSEWLCFLDADDELADGYIDAMREAIAKRESTRCMYTPQVSYVVRGKPMHPKFWPEKPLHENNWMVIGTVVPRDLFLEVGGFEDWPHAYEDWQLFAKMWKAGAEVERVPDAVYRAHWMPNSRNKSMGREEAVRLHYEIGKRIFPEHYTSSWLNQHLRNVPRTARARRR